MDLITKNILIELMNSSTGLTVSIYIPTYPTGREAEQNPIKLKNQIQTTEESLSAMGKSEMEIEDFLSPIFDIVDDEIFWQEQNEGLALFLDRDSLHIFRLDTRFDPLTVIGSSYHIKPLIPYFQGNGQFFLLSLDKNRPKLFKGSKNKLFHVQELDLPESLQEVFDDYFKINRHLQFHTKTQTPNPDNSGDREGIYFGHGAGEIDEQAEIRNYFHRFNDALMNYLHDKDVPMLLAGLSYLHPLYRDANSYPGLLEKGIEKDVSPLSHSQLHQEAWEIVEDQFQFDVEQALNVYNQLEGKDGETTQDLQDIVSAANFKRVHTLFVAKNDQIWGYFDPDQNAVVFDDQNHANTEDLLNFAARKTLLYDGNVVVLPKEEVPGAGPIAAILRY
jgi:hypothetical protein